MHMGDNIMRSVYAIAKKAADMVLEDVKAGLFRLERREKRRE
jgi:hypothetical protein